ncbi:MAG: hypothetical protein K2X37_01440 [Chitinophagaceae bacterium]|nr:hypothetical protein [Chitinophagaceae bacterium]
MKQKFENLGNLLGRDLQKKLIGGEEKLGECLSDYTYDCSGNSACCSGKCETNGTNT